MSSNFDLAPEQWASLRQLLDQGLELPASEREAWLAGLEPPCPELVPRLRALLAHAGSPALEEALETLPRVETAAFAPYPPDHASGEGSPERVGPYRLLRLLGEGGMATVWLAERTDMLQRRQVALKLPHGHWRRAGLAERLAREREILATLNHPNIARLYDAGLTADGQPYLAIELVEGERIDRWCERRQLDLPGRLRLFLQVARAVAHAHANLVVHRDLKPGNILVTENVEVRLLDFGIAKLLDQGVAAQTELTQQSGRPLTPEYAAPEQILGTSITTAADIYALGVVLFELLAGRRPYVLKRDSRAALEDAIVQAEPAWPSRVAVEPGLRTALRGDLDTIVLKALRKTPEERYRTADALAEDIERYLKSEPVLARPDRAWYRARKFVARNRLAVAASAAVALAVVAGAAVAGWQARVAVAEQRRAAEVKAFIASIFADANPYVGRGARPLSAREMLLLARDRIEGIGRERADLRVELLEVTAASLLGLGETDAAEAIARQAVAEAAALGPAHPLNLRARLLLTDVHRQRGDTREMRAALAALVGQLRPIAQERPEEYVRALMNSAHMEIDDGHPEAAIRAAGEAFALAVKRFGERDPRTIDASTLFAETQQYETLTSPAALAAAERGMRFAEAARRDQPAHPQVIYMRDVYARSLLMDGQDARAVEEASRAMRDAAVAFGPESPMEGDIAGNIVPAQRRLGQIKAALENSSRGLRILDRHSQRDSRTRAVHVTGRGVTWLAARNGERALDDLSEASALLEGRAGPTAPETLTANLNRALALAYVGRTAEAQARIAPLVEAYRVHTPEHLNYAYYVQGVIARLAGRAAEGLALQRQAIAAASPGRNGEWQRMRILPEIGLAQVDAGLEERALESFDEALGLLQRLQTEASPMLAETWLGKGRALLALSRSVEARVVLAQADAFWRDFDGGSRWSGEAAFWLARADEALGRPGEARAGYRRAVPLLATSSLPGDKALVAATRRR